MHDMEMKKWCDLKDCDFKARLVSELSDIVLTALYVSKNWLGQTAQHTSVQRQHLTFVDVLHCLVQRQMKSFSNTSSSITFRLQFLSCLSFYVSPVQSWPWFLSHKNLVPSTTKISNVLAWSAIWTHSLSFSSLNTTQVLCHTQDPRW